MSDELENQLLGFPNLKEDDLVDAMNYSLEDNRV
jgi:phage terminase large subunit-like protein